MRICYVDEAGDTGTLPSDKSDVQPVLVIAGVDIPQECVHELTREFIDLKKKFFPGLAPPDSTSTLAWILSEIKGSELRKQAVDPRNRNTRRHAIFFLESVIALLERNDARLSGRVWIKGIGAPINHRSIYTFSLQHICQCFNDCLATDRLRGGIVVADSRNKTLNTQVSYSIFTQKYKARGDAYPNLFEMPLFGHSENHAGVQIADLLCSALLFPLAIQAYCQGIIQGIHMRDYSELRERFTTRLEAMQVRKPDPDPRQSRFVGGVMIDDKLAHRQRRTMFPGGR